MLVILTLTVIVAGFTRSMSVEMRLARNSNYDVQLEWAGRAGVEIARYYVTQKENKQTDCLKDEWAGGVGSSNSAVASCLGLENVPCGDVMIKKITITDMERKWDINILADPKAPQIDIIRNGLQVVGVTDVETISTVTDSILDWIDPDDDHHVAGAENQYYQGQSPPYYCKNGRIDDLNELLLVKGVTRGIYWGPKAAGHPLSAFEQHGNNKFEQGTYARKSLFRNNEEPAYAVGMEQLFSAMGGKLNVNTASAQTLAMIPGMDETLANAIVTQRNGLDGQPGTDDDVPLRSPGDLNNQNFAGGPALGQAAAALGRYCDIRSYVFEVQVDTEINGYQRTFYGIISRAGPNPNQLMTVRFYWK